MKRKSIKKKNNKRKTVKRGGTNLTQETHLIQETNLYVATKIFERLNMELTNEQIRSYSSIVLSKLKEEDINEIITAFRSEGNENLKEVLIKNHLAINFGDTFLISLPTIS